MNPNTEHDTEFDPETDPNRQVYPSAGWAKPGRDDDEKEK